MKFFALKYTPGKYLKTLFLNPFHSLFIISVILVFVCIFSTKTQAQRLPVGFYDEIDKKVLVDSSAKIFISSIKITGNKKTKKYLIEREMRLKTGDSSFATSFHERLTRSQELIYNTNLFTEVTLVPFFNTATDVSINVTVKEKWYIYPTPQFQLVDRNFNEWLNLSNGSLDRVIYGAKFAHYNLSGRRDQLRIYLLNGYARNLSFSYTAPYSNKTLTEGFSVAAGYTQNREITYKTSSENLPLRYQNDGFVRNSFTISASYIMRKGYYRKHIFSISYSNLNVDDSITNFYNKAYFNTPKNYVGYPEAVYTYQYSNTNNINYPLKGKIYSLIILKRGFGFTGGINMLSIEGDYNKFMPHNNNWYSSFKGHAKIKAPFNLAFYNQRALGYSDFYLRGLENYVIDGVASFMANYTLKKKIISFNIPIPFKNSIASVIPFSIFAKTYTDMGYSYNKPAFETRLGNRFLYSGGLGLDILSLYDINLRLEYSFNQLGEKGLFLHAKGGF